jgi:hypothetical protein
MGFNRFGKIIAAGSLLFSAAASAQPYIDLFSFSYQSLSTSYKGDTLNNRNLTQNYFFNSTIPIKIDSQNMLITRLYAEQLQSQFIPAADYNSWNGSTDQNTVSSALISIGLQHETKNKKWKFLGLAMPKISSDFRNKISSNDFQMGGYGLATWTKSEDFKVKFGLFYNREFFGNFFVPVFAIDWKVNKRFQMYGALPNFYRFEFMLLKQKLYTGLGFKSYTRSYLSNAFYSNAYIRNTEIQVKLFLDTYIAKRFVLYGEFGRTISYSPTLYYHGTKDKIEGISLYNKLNDAFFFNVGLAYRIRFDFQ